MKAQVASMAILSAAASAAQTESSPRARHTAAGIEPLLAKIAAYDYGADPDSIVAFTELVEDLQRSPEQRKALEARLLQFLKSNATAPGKEVALRQLALIGTNASIPVLAPLLARAETAEMARYALAAIPGATVDEALRNSLGQAPDERGKIGIINSLGNRKDAKAVPALAALISPANPAVTAAAVAALANIADRAALKALAAARSKAGSQVRNLITEGYLVCADRFAERGESATATGVYKQMLAPGEPRMIRTRALAGLTAANAKAAVRALTVEIESKDPEVRAAAIKLLNGIPGSDITRVMVSEFPKLPPFGQVQLLTAMAYRGDASAKPTILAALKSTAPEVRAAALVGLGKLGDESSVTILAEAAASGQGPERSAARRSLYSLRGAGIDRALISAMGSSSGRVKIELIMAAGERAATSAADALTRAARETDPDARRESLRALRNVGGAGQTPALLDLLLKASTTTERREATQTLATVLKRAQPAPLGAVISAYQAASGLNSRLSLLEVMGQTSSSEALPVLRAGIKDASPEIARGAILALSAWDNSTPLMDLLNFAKTLPRDLEARGPEAAEPRTNLARAGRGGQGGGGRGAPPANNLQVLALRGVLRLVLLQPRRPASESGRLLAEAMGLASQNAEKLTILSLLPSFPSQESLEVARTAQRGAAVANEAKLALDQVTEALKLK